jgi:glycosyltransferase involved in cell wall biosynthesis
VGDLISRSYVVVVSNGIGGAEKRFFDTVRGLVAAGEKVCFVAPSSLVEKLLEQSDIGSDQPWIIPLGVKKWSVVNAVRAVYRFVKAQPKGAHYHYPMSPLFFVHFLRGDTVSISLCNCINVPKLLSFSKTRVLQYLASKYAAHIDVLSPAIKARVARFGLKAKVTLTPGGTYVFPSTEGAAAGHHERKIITFMSRLEKFKGVEEYLGVLRSLHRAVDPTLGLQYVICGDGTLAEYVKRSVIPLAAAGVPVRYVGNVNPGPLLSRSLAVLSLQSVTNFPSRVVAEAAINGCQVLIRDTGDSKAFGDYPWLTYLKPSLDPLELAREIERIHLKRSSGTKNANDEAHARTVYSSPLYIDYFRRILSRRTLPHEARSPWC